MKKFLQHILVTAAVFNAITAYAEAPATKESKPAPKYKFNLSGDRTMSAKTGADITSSVVEGWSMLIDNSPRDHDSFAFKFARAFLDIVVSELVVTGNHEVFGHGGRAREFSLPVTYKMSFTGGSTSYYVKDHMKLKPYQRVMFTLGGMEASTVLAQKYQNRFLTDGKVGPTQSAAYLVSNHDQTMYTLSKFDSDSHDVRNYIDEVNFYYGKKVLSKSKLRSSAFLNLLDPFTVYSLMSFATGEDQEVHMIKFGDIGYLPGLRSVYTFYGTELKLMNYFKMDNKLVELGILYGNNKTGKSYGADLKLTNVLEYGSLGLGGHFAVWKQPELLQTFALGDHTRRYIRSHTGDISSTPISKKTKQGGLAALNVSYTATDNLSFNLEVGYKTKGYSVGEVIKASPILKAGLSINL